MTDPTELRAKRCRGVVTSVFRFSGQAADRQLLALAIKLEHMADDIEKHDKIANKKSSQKRRKKKRQRLWRCRSLR